MEYVRLFSELGRFTLYKNTVWIHAQKKIKAPLRLRGNLKRDRSFTTIQGAPLYIGNLYGR